MFFKVLFYLPYGLRKWQSPFRLQRKATPVSVLLYCILNPTEGGGQRETLLSIYWYPQLVSGMCLWLEGSLDHVPITPLTCLFKHLCIASELPVLTAIRI